MKTPSTLQIRLSRDVVIPYEVEGVIPPKPTYRTEWVYVTPRLAEMLLSTYNTKNRNIVETRVASLATQMMGDQFPVNGDTIRFSENCLLDGQHRLTSIRRSGKSLWILCVFDLPEDMIKFIDVGANRKPDDALVILKALEKPNASKIVQAARLIAQFLADGTIPKLSVNQIFTIVRQHHEDFAWGQDFIKGASKNKNLPYTLLAAFIFAHADVSQRPKVEAIAARYLNGAGMEEGTSAWLIHKSDPNDAHKKALREQNTVNLFRRYLNATDVDLTGRRLPNWSASTGQNMSVIRRHVSNWEDTQAYAMSLVPKLKRKDK